MFGGTPRCFSVRWFALILERYAALDEVAVRFPTVMMTAWDWLHLHVSFVVEIVIDDDESQIED